MQSLLPGKILAVQVGLSRTAVLVETDDGIRCGLAATLSNPDFDHRRRPSVRNAGHLHEANYTDLAGLIDSSSFTEVSIGLATINALLPRCPTQWVDLNAEEYLVQQGRNKTIAVVGRFPFIERLQPLAQKVWVLELSPKEDDLPACMAPNILPQADLIAITATTLINKTFQGLIDLCRADARVILVGPSTPLSPTLFQFGIEVLSGTIVTNPEKAMLGIGQGISLQQLRREGTIRLVTMKKDRANGK